jgi:sarcosine oxidase subunit delta
MILIDCPWCGPREDSEFGFGGEAHIARPTPSASASDAEWGEYLFMRTNPRGLHREQWFHAAGCRRWFYVERDTVSYRVLRVYRVGDPVGGADRP